MLVDPFGFLLMQADDICARGLDCAARAMLHRIYRRAGRKLVRVNRPRLSEVQDA